MTTNFVDDSSSVISFKNTVDISKYLSDYNLLDSYYDINHLCINADKSKLLFVNKPKRNPNLVNFSFQAGCYVIKPLQTLKNLGFYFKSNLKMDSQVGNLCSTLHFRIHQLKLISSYMDFKTRLCLITSFVIGKLIYASPLYMGMDKQHYLKLHIVIMSSASTSIGSYCFKRSTTSILNECNMMDIENLILFFLHLLDSPFYCHDTTAK